MKSHNVQPIIPVTYPFKRIEAASEEGEVRKLASLFCFLQNWWLTFYSKTIIIIEKIKENNLWNSNTQMVDAQYTSKANT